MLEVIFSGKFKGSNRYEWNLRKDNNPIGQIWTFKERGEEHPFHLKLLSGEYGTYPNLDAAIKSQWKKLNE